MATLTASNSSVSSPEDAGLVTEKHHDGVKFVVHTKHTCDKCFQRPILGQRFTSGTKSNFDLCARCYEEYTGPDIGLTEAVLGKYSRATLLLRADRCIRWHIILTGDFSVRDNKISHDFVLKLKIDNGGDGT